MNKMPGCFYWSCIILIFLFIPSQAQDGDKSEPQKKYRMELVYIFENNTIEYIFVIGVSGYKSVDSLKKYLSILPEGATLEWAPGCRRLGREPLLSSELELEEFKAFCAEKKINFIILPSG